MKTLNAEYIMIIKFDEITKIINTGNKFSKLILTIVYFPLLYFEIYMYIEYKNTLIKEISNKISTVIINKERKQFCQESKT